MDKTKNKYWTQTVNACIEDYQSNLVGLSQKEASLRLKTYGTNELTKVRRLTIVEKFLRKVINPLILLLLSASLISAFIGEITNFLIIFSMVLISIVVDLYQQHHAENAADKLKQRVLVKAQVLRSGQVIEVPLAQIVPGDIVVLSAGDIVAADGRIVESKGLLVDQSALTGESAPQEKTNSNLVHQDAALSQRNNCVFMGTNVISGEGKFLVTQTGSATEYGKISEKVSELRSDTEFDTGIKSFGFLLMRYTLILVIFIFFINVTLKHDFMNSFLFAMALAIGLTPELLPIIVTINLAKGATRMSQKDVIVKYLPSIENFGSMDVLCTDKTGTLTENHIELERYEDATGEENKFVLLAGYLNSYFQNGIKSPLEEAILDHHELSIAGFSKTDEIPFDFERKRLSVIVEHHQDNYLIVKGAPEEILHLCHNYIDLSNEGATENFNFKEHQLIGPTREKIIKRFSKLSEDGFRVLAVAIKSVSGKKAFGAQDETGLSFVGLMAFLDPPKQSAKEALKKLEKSGVELKILTGDNELVTKRVCLDLELPVKNILLGEQLSKMSDHALKIAAKETTIFARLDPVQKQRIICALREQGSVVGYLGDGINDAPALKNSDVGISVDNAVDVAKESADMILLKKDLMVLIQGVVEGRKTYGNVMKYIMVGTSVNSGNMFSMAGASTFLPFLPILPTQLLLNNLLFDISQLSIPSDNVDPESLDKPRRWNIQFIKKFMLLFGAVSSAFDYLTFFILLAVFNASERLFQTGWFIESLATQLLIIFSIRTIRSPFFKSWPSLLLTVGVFTILIITLILPITPIGALFMFTPLPLKFYFVLLGLVLSYFVVIEITKKLFYSKLNY
ncbi:magnesium-translocating P-type ATPase [Patescibacteria group bacterium]|nr:magnesium-translocating P-type ATPase [Patescibacteria group bacterium]